MPSPTPFQPPGDPATKPRVRRLGSLVNQLISRRGYAQVSVNEQLQQTIATVLSESLHSCFQVGNLRGGVLQIYAADSVTLQELNFQKRVILKRLQEEKAFQNIVDVRFRIQST
ncbi:MAG: DUF721 domain-containing protein [Rubripirellula sp.]|nr:DUF721 domain-containing protein [Rubripirellula sp.]